MRCVDCANLKKCGSVVSFASNRITDFKDLMTDDTFSCLDFKQTEKEIPKAKAELKKYIKSIYLELR